SITPSKGRSIRRRTSECRCQIAENCATWTPLMNPLEIIRERWLFLHCGVGASETVPNVVEGIDSLVEKVLARQTPDGNPYGRPLSHAEFTFGTDVFAQIEKLAIAWRCPFSRYSQKPEILEKIIAGLRFGEPYIRPNQPRD